MKNKPAPAPLPSSIYVITATNSELCEFPILLASTYDVTHADNLIEHFQAKPQWAGFNLAKEPVSVYTPDLPIA